MVYLSEEHHSPKLRYVSVFGNIYIYTKDYKRVRVYMSYVFFVYSSLIKKSLDPGFFSTATQRL